MDTTAPQSGATTAGTAGITSIADDRVEGWAAIIEAVCGQSTTLREGRQRLTVGKYPIWREGRRVVASKAALLAHWHQKAAQAMAAPEKPGMQNRGARRGYRPA